MRYLLTLGLVFFSGICYAQPPKLEIEKLIEAKGDYVTFVPITDATVVTYIGLSGVEPFPSEMLKDSKSFVLPIRGLKDNTYHFVAIAIKQNDFTRREFSVKVGQAPQPPPDVDPKPPIPEPKPKPDPALDDAPTTTAGLHVAILHETGQRVTQAQFNVMYGKETRNYLDTVCDRLNSTPQWRIIDKDAQTIGEPWKSLLKRKHPDLPWLVVMSGKKYVYEGKLPESSEELVKLIDKYKPTHRTDHCPNCPAPYTFQQVPIK